MGRRASEPSVNTVRWVGENSEDLLLHLIVSVRSKEEAYALLSDLLTRSELRKVQKRVKAFMAVVASATTEKPETTICKDLKITYTTYGNAKRILLENERSGMRSVLFRMKDGSREFSELRKASGQLKPKRRRPHS